MMQFHESFHYGKASSNNYPSTTMLDSWYGGVCADILCLVLVKHLHFDLICSKDIVPEVL